MKEIRLRLEDEVHDALKKRAKEAKRSMQAQAAYEIEKGSKK